MQIPEEFIAYVWRNRLFNHEHLITTDGQPLRILHSGILNTQQGPDFLQAKIQIGEVILFGNVEIHVKSSDWLKHGHQKDNAYQNIVLHVVYNDDKSLRNMEGSDIPTLELNGRIFPSLLKKYHQLNLNTQKIKCKNLIKDLDAKDRLKLESWKERLVVDRMMRKSDSILKELPLFNHDWAQMMFAFFGKYLGGKLNGDAFFLLCKNTSLQMLHKHRKSLKSVEAILFGQAGMLEDELEDEYYQNLKNEYAYFQKVYNLIPLQPEIWKYFRLRPTSFPTIRIAQLADIVHHYFNFGLSGLELDIWDKKLGQIKASAYWNDHYLFGRKSERDAVKHPGRQLTQGMQINVMIPFRMAYAKSQGDMETYKSSLELLHSISMENNEIVRMWEETGFESSDAYDTQAYNEWMNEYCNKGRCIECSLGNIVLRSSYDIIENKENSIFKERKLRWKLRSPEKSLI